MKKYIYEAEVLENVELAHDIMRIVILAPDAAKAAVPGQFINFYPKAESTILPRPISISDADASEGTLSIVYAIVGKGTDELSKYVRGDIIKISSPLGNGFDITAFDGEDAPGSAVLIGGGIGTAPMVHLSRELAKRGVDCTAVIGFRKEPFLASDLEANGCKVLVTTDVATEKTFMGTVVDCMEINAVQADAWFACGPKPMLAAVSRYVYGINENAVLQVSMEERMGCGYGACVGCVCEIKDPDNPGGIIKKKVCKDGPVFIGSEVIW